MLHVSRALRRATWHMLLDRAHVAEGREIGAHARARVPDERGPARLWPSGVRRDDVAITALDARITWPPESCLVRPKSSPGSGQTAWAPRETTSKHVGTRDVEAAPTIHSIRTCAWRQSRATAKIPARFGRGSDPGQSDRRSERYGVSLAVRTIAQKLSIGVSS